MRVKGRRRCTECGQHWSYYDTGEISCPECGSIRSVSTVEEPTRHTATPVELDLSDAIAAVASRPLREVAEMAESASRQYLSKRGFIDAGTLQPLDDTAVAASHLRFVAADIANSIQQPPDPVEAHFLDLLNGATAGSRPDSVPSALRGAYGLAIADVVDRYRTAVSTWLDERPDRPREVPLAHLRDRQKRIEALDGEVPTAEAEQLLSATRSLGQYVRSGEEEALEAFWNALADLQ